jgi:DNA-binding transcriptional ArsR family regulator
MHRMKTGNLPIELAAQLTPRDRDALGHPVRRQILRALNESDAPRSPLEIAATTLPQRGVGVVSYHALVLAGCGSVRLSGTRQVRGSLARLYVSAVAEDEQIASVLQATRELDSSS